MSGKSIGITVLVSLLTLVALAAFIMWYSAETPSPESPLVAEVTANTDVAQIDKPPFENSPQVLHGAGDPETAPLARLMVEIQGAVTAPGVYSFPPEARVHDALEKAGGPLEHAEIRDINIAAALVDGSVLSVPYQQQDGGPRQPGAADLNPPGYTRSGWADTTPAIAAPAAGVPATPASTKVNINTATQSELETLPGVGEKTAEKIMRHRETQRFTQVDDLGFVQGIGEKRMETLRPHVTVD